MRLQTDNPQFDQCTQTQAEAMEDDEPEQQEGVGQEDKLFNFIAFPVSELIREVLQGGTQLDSNREVIERALAQISQMKPNFDQIKKSKLLPLLAMFQKHIHKRRNVSYEELATNISSLRTSW